MLLALAGWLRFRLLSGVSGLTVDLATSGVVLLASTAQDHRYNHLESIDKKPLKPCGKLKRKTERLLFLDFTIMPKPAYNEDLPMPLYLPLIATGTDSIFLL